MRRGRSALLLAAVGGCAPVPEDVSPAPIPVTLAPAAGLYAMGAVLVGGAPDGPPFTMLVDTGTVLSTRATAAGSAARIRTETLRLLDLPSAACGGAGAGPIARAEFADVTLLETPLFPQGVGDGAPAFGGILAGDLLQAFSLELRYAPAAAADGGVAPDGGASGCAPTIALEPAELACSCAVADACAATLGFTLSGGGPLQLGTDFYNYPATRVLLDACLEPVADPIARGVPCIDDSGVHQPGYEVATAPGVDVRLLVATGFPGVVIGKGAWDRLRGAGAAESLLAGPGLVPIHTADRPDPSPAALATLAPATATDGGTSAVPRAAMVLVGREGLLGACGELARSRRLRWRASHPTPPTPAVPDSLAAPDCSAGSCPAIGGPTCLQQVPGDVCGSPDQCCDLAQPAAALVELDAPIPVYVVDDDTFPLLEGVNADLLAQSPPQGAVVEGVIGTELLARLQARIDYPNQRVIARCADASGCTVFPRFACPSQVADCGPRGEAASQLCNPPSSIPASTSGAPACLPAPIDRDGGV